jgi:large subunit ribosomal protein L30e
MDLGRQLKNAMNTGLLLLGQNQTADACAKGEAKLVILAANCPSSFVNDLSNSHPDVPIHMVPLVNRELGAACAKPFHISAICILDPGNSELLTLRPNLD